MPIFYFDCPGCGAVKRKLLEPEQYDALKQSGGLACDCGVIMTRNPKPPSSHVKETLDNGLMAKRVDRFKDIEELMDERTHTDYRNKID